MTPRSHRPPEERQIVSEVHRLLNEPGLMRGTLVRTKRRCGKPGCRCAGGKRLHLSWYVSQSHQGRLRMRCVPKAWEDRVRQWIQRHHRVREFLERLSERYWRRLIQRED